MASSSKRKLPFMFAAAAAAATETGKRLDKKWKDGGGSGRGGGQEEGYDDNKDEEALQRALQLSAEEARIAGMDEAEQIKAAIEQSLNEDSKKDFPSAPLLTQKQQQTHDQLDDSLLPLQSSAFDDRRETVIDRLGGSLDLLMCKSWIKVRERTALREWMLSNLAWHRVTYVRPSTKQRIVTPRFTATFGKDDTGAPDSVYRAVPKPFPPTLAHLRDTLERKTNARFNAIIVNFYSDGNDAISYHSDDEHFLGPCPTIASVSLGASRDFYLRRKAPAALDVPAPRPHEQMGTKGKGPAATRPTEKMVLDDGDLLVMRGRTQADWEHSIPKRTRHVGGRINITFRRVINVSGTNNFIRYNRIGDGDGVEYRWNAASRQMVPGEGGI